MISIEPQTTVVLCSVPWENDYKNQRLFENATKQAEYFNSLNKQVFTNFTYQRKDGYIDVGVNIESIRNFNYVYYANTGFTNKIFYAFITDMEYMGENITRLTIETDVFQTWQFDLVYHKCFVEREHVSDDTIGLHTLPENVETGEYICNSVTRIGTSYNLNNCYACISSTYLPPEMISGSVQVQRCYGSIYSGSYYIIINDSSSLNILLSEFDQAGKADAISSIFMVPKEVCRDDNGTDLVLQTYTSPNFGTTYQAAIIPNTLKAITIATQNISINSDLDNYTPKNNKLFVYPYNYMQVTNNNGTDVVYRYEDFVSTPTFKTVGVISPGCSIVTYPKNYKKYTDTEDTNYSLNNYNYGIPAGKYPICSWNTDTYVNWLTQNSLNLNFTRDMGFLTGALGVAMAASGMATIAGLGMAGGGITAITQANISQYQHSLIPPEQRGSNVGDVTFSSNNTNILLKKMSVRSEYAKIIDDFFEMFGYKVNSLKVPNINNRPYWNYVKTIDCNFEADIPNDDLLLIRKMFNDGVTLWHTNDMYDYTKNNH